MKLNWKGFFFAGAMIMMYVMLITGKPLKTPVTPNGILNLEFAYNSTKANLVTQTWASINSIDTIAAAKLNTWLDFIFIFFYTGFLFLAAKKIAFLYGGGFSKAGKLISKGALLAGIFDCFENTGMLLTLSGHSSESIAFCTTFFSAIKWFLALLALLYVLTGTIGSLRNRIIN